MARRPGAGGIDRHTLLSSGGYASPSQSAYPRSHSPAGGPSGAGGGLGAHHNGGPASLAGYRTASPFEQPYTPGSGAGAGASRSGSGGGIYQRPGAGLGGASSYGGAGGPSWDDEYGKGKKDMLPGGYPNGGQSSGGGGGGWTDRIRSYAQQRTAEDLEEANDERLEGLSARVKMLKDITVGIGNEVRDSTKDLDVLGGAFSTTSAFLGGTFIKMNRMASRQSSWFCNMMLFILFVIWIFVFLWWWRR
ncbi:hypothetical protein V8E36_002592 [Tilletia maclaganii]